MRTAWFLSGVALLMSIGVEAQERPQRAEARKQQEQIRKEREEARKQERAQRDAFLERLTKIERERGLADAAGADRIFFAPGNAALSKDAELVLIRAIHWLRLNPTSVLQVQERCSQPVNRALSTRRTRLINEFLVDYSANAKQVQRLAPATISSSGEIGASADDCAVFLSATANQ